jgi:hypothetical protein
MTRPGELRIHFGAAPGVGKTFAMLCEARRRRDRGTDVVVGLSRPTAGPRRPSCSRVWRSCPAGGSGAATSWSRNSTCPRCSSYRNQSMIATRTRVPR